MGVLYACLPPLFSLLEEPYYQLGLRIIKLGANGMLKEPYVGNRMSNWDLSVWSSAVASKVQ